MANIVTLFMFCTLILFVGIINSSSNIIKLDNGQTYACVDFYKQPAFRDQVLNLEALPNVTRLQQQQNNVSGLGFEDLGCPIGTVPILQHSQLDALGAPSRLFPSLGNAPHCSAKVQTRANDPNKRFLGASAAISIYKPVAVMNQWSSSRFKIINGGDSIEAGWTVNQNRFNDGEAHLYAAFNAGGKGCMNLDCPEFVQVSTGIALGISPHRYSPPGGQQIVWRLSIDKNINDGNWWLSIQAVKHLIGYWPNNLFTSLRDFANQVEFGGEINDENQKAGPPEMGIGHKAAYNTESSSCFFSATVFDEHLGSINPPDTEKYADCSEYTVLDGGYHDDPELGRLVFYGGPDKPL